jgi:PIN domain nuclease of toxin-antitoxin system
LSVAYLDTHVAVFLHDGLTEEFSTEAKRQLEANDLLICPMVLLEFGYLFKRKKIGVDAKSIFTALNTSFGVALCPFPFAAIAHEALDVRWTEDPFDRLIVAQARVNHEAKLITRDRLIRKNYSNAVW